MPASDRPAKTGRAVVLDPLNRESRYALGESLFYARRYKEGVVALQDTLALDRGYAPASGYLGLNYYALGNVQSARSSCEIEATVWVIPSCLAVTYNKLGRHADAAGMLAKLQAMSGNYSAWQYAEIYAQWGDTTKALEWLEAAVRLLRDEGLVEMKADSLLDPVRKEPRFQAIEQALKFPT